MTNNSAEQRKEAKKAVLLLYHQYASKHNCDNTQSKEAFSKLWSEGSIHRNHWARTHVPKLCRATICNWITTIKEHGVKALAGNYGIHRLGAGKIDSQPVLQNFILECMQEKTTCAAIFEKMKNTFACDLKVRLPSLRRIQAWVTKNKVETACDTLVVALCKEDYEHQISDLESQMADIKYKLSELKSKIDSL